MPVSVSKQRKTAVKVKTLTVAASILLALGLGSMVLMNMRGHATKENVPARPAAVTIDPDDAKYGDLRFSRWLRANRNVTELNMQTIAINVTDAGLATFDAVKPPYLVKLNMDHCIYFTSDGLRFLIHLPSLRVLELGQCNISDGAMDWIGQITTLNTLNASRCPFTDDSIAKLSKSPLAATLCHIDLTETGISNDGLKHIPRFKALKTLNLGRNKFTDAGIPFLSGCETLEEVRLINCPITGSTLASLSNLKHLRKLFLSGTNVSQNLKQLGKLRIEVLNLSECGLTNDTLKDLSENKRLQVLNLNDNNITNSGLMNLVTLPELVKISVKGTEVTAQGKNEFIERYRQLTGRLAEINIAKEG
jgi:hypothetical protein